MLKVPYERKNAAFDSLEELHRVRGISDDFWATFVDPDPDDPKSRIVTVWGSDKLNVNTSNAIATLAAVCAAVPLGQPTPVCTDMVTRAKAVSLLEMFRQLSSGIPVFRSVNQFTSMLKPSAAGAASANPASSATGLGAMGSLMSGPPSLEMMGIPPIVGLVDALLHKTLGVQSQVFSIYATGIVKNGRRETRSRIHAVVDMRGTPPPGQARNIEQYMQMMMGGGAMAGAMANAQTSATSGSAQPLPTSLPTAPQPDGNVVYYRIN